MSEHVCIIGLDEAESSAIAARLDRPVVAHAILPRIVVRDGELRVEAMHGRGFVGVSHVIYHGIFDDDFDLITGLALWGGACLPNARAMMDARLKYACLVRALTLTRFGAPRGYAASGTRYYADSDHVAKWGNWHCGENKARFNDVFVSEQPTVIEPFFEGQAVRVALIGDQAWQIRLDGEDWLKSIHHDAAAFMPIDPDLLADTQAIRDGFGLEIIANDYIVGTNGEKYLLEVNHIPNVTRFEAMRTAYIDYSAAWVNQTIAQPDGAS